MRAQHFICLSILVILLSGCAVIAPPCRITGVIVKVVPVVGGTVGAVFDACGNIID